MDFSKISERLGKSRGLKAAAFTAIVIAGAVAVMVMLRSPSGGDIWKTSFATGQFKYFLALCGVFILLLATFVGLLVRKRRRPMAGESGAVLVEFTMILPIILMIVLLLYQSALLVTGHLFVTYSAFCAARSAIVYIPADMGAGRNKLYSEVDPRTSPKIWNIKRAAVWAVMPICDGSYEQLGDDTDFVTDGLTKLYQYNNYNAPNWVNDYLGSKLAYAEEHTSVKIAPARANDTYGAHEDLHVQVTHDMYMAIPYVGGLFSLLDSNVVEIEEGKFAMKVKIECTMPNQGIMDEIVPETFPKDD